MNTDPQQTSPETDPALEADARAHQADDVLAPEQADDPVAKLTAERDDMRDRWIRAEAEMQNVRARAKRDVDDARQYAIKKFAEDVAEAAENLRRGLSSLPPVADDEPAIVTKLREGFESIERSFVGILERNGVKRVDPTGQPFDANLHQAMAEQPSSEHPPGTVIQAWTQGWTLNGRLLKPAMVVVAKAEAASAAPEDASASA
jgi:molecular chaperone GrpE